MSDQAFHKKFIFNDKIDSDFLYGMYEDDYLYIEEVFLTTLTQLDPDLHAINHAFESGDTLNLKKAVHKVKPSFGFVGLLSVQESCQDFEDACAKASAMQEVSTRYQHLWTIISESKNIIESEYRKLKAFNSSAL